MNDALGCLVGDRIERAERIVDADLWVLYFASGSVFNIYCLWRLVIDGRIIATSADHGHQFGLDRPYDGLSGLKEVTGKPVTEVSAPRSTCDVSLFFGTAVCLELIQTSGAYESWTFGNPGLPFVVGSAH
jgi:hypothetical protein